jgi:acyl-CoA synthetase (AMP-forming)/AMP-acid ligase II
MGFVERFAERGQLPALVFADGRQISYAELARRVAALTGEFGPGKKLVAMQAANSEHAIIAYLAALHGGHTAALLSPCDPDALEAFEADFRPDVTFRMADGRWRATHNRGGGAALHPDLAVLLATSGSTGKARFVRLSRRNIESNAHAIADYLGLMTDDRGALILPFHYCYGLSVLNSHLAAGASIFVSDKGVADPGIAEDIGAACCTNISGVPYSFELMEKTGFRERELQALRFMTVAGGRMPPDLVETYRRHLASRGAELFLMYGQTEATARIAYVPPEALAGNTDCIGIAIPGGQLSLLDESGRLIEACGVAGELVYRGPNVMMGYALDRADLAKGADVDELSTGDLAERCPNGFYRIVGRLKRISKIGGLRVSHEAMEHALASQGIEGAVAGDDRRLVAAVVSAHGLDLARRIVIETSGLTALHVDAVKVEALPRLASGKVDHAAIARLAEARRPVSAHGILEAFRHAFYPRRVTPADSFDSLGGDSLLYVQLSLMLERELERIPEGWERMPVGDLAGLRREEAPARLIDTELVLRALAILLVVVHHATLWPIPGGAAALVMLVGYGLARFHSRSLISGDVMRVMRPLAANLAVYAPIVVGFSIARGEILWPSVFLVGNVGLFDPKHMLPYVYWFVEAYAQIVLIWAGLFSFARVRRAAARDPFSFGFGLLIVAVAAKLLAPAVWKVGAVQIFTVADVLYLAVLGWCVRFARARWQKLVLLGTAAFLFPLLAYNGGNWTGSWVKFMLQLFCVAILLYRPRITIPKQAASFVLPISAASYHIYLFHRFLPDLLLPQPEALVAMPLATAAAVVSGVVTGLIMFALQKRLLGLLARRRAPHHLRVTVAKSGL